MISCKYCKIFKSAYFGEHLGTDAFLGMPEKLDPGPLGGTLRWDPKVEP